MSLKEFLKGKDSKVKVRIQLQLNMDMKEEDFSKEVVLSKAHLFDVLSWNVQLDNYEPLVVVTIR